MKHEHDRAIEIELCASELSSLAHSVDDEMSRAALYGYLSPPTIRARAATAQRRGRMSNARTIGVLTTGVIAGIAVAAHYEFSGAAPDTQARAVEWTPLPERAQSLEAEPEVPPPPEPTRFVNPFDKTEVFELPPGLTHEEAREIVAEILLERARERMR
jgi:hypothetical protein